MRKEVIETGKNVEAAIEAACVSLGCDREECEWEILELPKKSFLGLKTTPAKVKVSIQIPEKKIISSAVEQSASATEKTGVEQVMLRTPEIPEEPVKQKTQNVSNTAATATVEPDSICQKKIAITKDYIRSLLLAMGLEATINTRYEEGGAYFNIEGQGLGMIIGRRGETLDAIQYLSSLVANRLEGEYLRITVDCGDYRAKRKETLEALARKLANQVIKTNISKTLEPMNPFERRIIHATVSDIEGVSSISIGEEPNRRVVITSPTARSARGNRSGRDNRSGDRRDSRDRNRGRSGNTNSRSDDRRRVAPSSPKPPVVSQAPIAPKKTFEESVDTSPLYGKIDLD